MSIHFHWSKQTITGHQGAITAISTTPTQILTSGNDGLICCWSLEDGTKIREFHEHKGAVYGIRLTMAGGEEIGDSSAGRRRMRFVTYSTDCTARLWNITRSTSLQVSRGHTGPVTCIAMDAGSHYLFTGSTDGRIASWLMETGQRIHWFEGHTAPVIDLIVCNCKYNIF